MLLLMLPSFYYVPSTYFNLGTAKCEYCCTNCKWIVHLQGSYLDLNEHGSYESCKKFINMLNTNDLNTHITSHIPSKQVEFLYLQLSFTPICQMSSGLYRKPMAFTDVLHSTCFHLSFVNNNIIIF